MQHHELASRALLPWPLVQPTSLREVICEFPAWPLVHHHERFGGRRLPRSLAHRAPAGRSRDGARPAGARGPSAVLGAQEGVRGVDAACSQFGG